MENQVKKIERYLQLAVQQEHFTGTILIAHHGEIICNHGYGMATLQNPNKQNTVFHIASITKQFTAAAVMKLWESGKIDLHISINRYLPQEFQSAEWENVTVHHLLSHTSGIPDYDEKYYDPKTIGFCFKETIEKIIKEAGQKKLEFQPGTQWNYCNIGYTVLGAILEGQTGSHYTDLIKEYFLVPLQMTSARFHEKNYTVHEKDALGFRWDFKNKQFVDDDSEKIVGTLEDGGLLATTHDLYKWSGVIAGKRPDILSAEILNLMATPVPNMSTPYGGYGYGLGIDDFFGIRRIHHSGWMVGFTSEFCIYPEKDLVIIVLCNNTTADPIKIAEESAKIMMS